MALRKTVEPGEGTHDDKLVGFLIETRQGIIYS